MARIAERIADAEFSIRTALDAQGIRQAGQRACEAGRRFMSNTVLETGAGANFCFYEIQGPGGIVSQLKFAVSWDEEGPRSRAVSLAVLEFLTVRMTYAMIPVSPKSAPARISLTRFSDHLQRELLACPPTLVRADGAAGESDGTTKRRQSSAALILLQD